MQTGFSVLRENVVGWLDASSMTEESYDLLDRLEEEGRIDKLTGDAVNTFIFYLTAGGVLRVALSNLKYETYRERLAECSPYIRL